MEAPEFILLSYLKQLSQTDAFKAVLEGLGLFTAANVRGTSQTPFLLSKNNLSFKGGGGGRVQARHQQLGTAYLMALWNRTMPLLLLTHQACHYPPNSQLQSHWDTAFSPFSSVGDTTAPIRGKQVSVALMHHIFVTHLAQCQRPLENSQNPDNRQHMTLGFLICT